MLQTYHYIEALNAKYSKVGHTPFFSAEKFPWRRVFEKNVDRIKAELMEVLKGKDNMLNFHEVSPDQNYITNDNKWKTFFFYGYGHPFQENLDRCPILQKCLQKIPGLKTAFFSIFDSGKDVPIHRGPYNGLLRFHFGLKVPDPELCGIMVGGVTKHWHEGESMFFDDTYPHKAWNHSSDVRVVLFVDFLRPLPFLISMLNRFIVFILSRSGFVKRARMKILDNDRKQDY